MDEKKKGPPRPESMPSQGSDSPPPPQDSRGVLTPAERLNTFPAGMQVYYEQPYGHAQASATHPATEPGGWNSGVDYSSSSTRQAQGHPAYSSTAPGAGNSFTLGDSTDHGQSPHPDHVSAFQQSPAYGYDPRGQSYNPYDANTTVPYPSLGFGAAGSQPGYHPGNQPGYDASTYRGQSYNPYRASTTVPYSSLGFGAAGSQPGYHPGNQSGYVNSQVSTESNYSGMGNKTYGGRAQGHNPYYDYGSGYPQQQQQQQQQGQPGHGYYGARQGGRSYAIDPGKSYFVAGQNKTGPAGANLFVFHIPNNMSNKSLLNLFFPYGTVLSARIMTEPDTSRGKGFGFVSYDCPHAAAKAILALNGYQISGKRLKVQLKRNGDAEATPHTQGQDRRYPTHVLRPQGFTTQEYYARLRTQSHQRETLPSHTRAAAALAMPAPKYPIANARPSQHHNQRKARRDQQPAVDADFAGRYSRPRPEIPTSGFGHVPVQEYAPPNAERHRGSTSVLPPMGNLNQESESDDDDDDDRKPLVQSPLTDLKDIMKALPDDPDPNPKKE